MSTEAAKLWAMLQREPLGEVRRRAAAALRRKPAEPALLLVAAVAEAKAGDHARALQLLARIRRPDAAVLNAVAISRRATGDLGGARAAYEQALRLEPANPDLMFNLARLEIDDDRTAAAELLLRQALALRPDHGGALKNLGLCRLAEADPAGAVPLFRRAVALLPGDGLLWSNLAVALQLAGDLAAAAEAHDRALALAPQAAEAHNNRGALHLLLRQDDEAERAFRAALAIRPDYAEAEYGLAMSLLRRRRLAEGWPGWERRLARRGFRERPPTAPLWDGAPFSGTLLVHGEIGFGDALAFCRFLPAARRRCDRVVFACGAPLVNLLAANLPGVEVVVDHEPLPAADRFCYVMSLPAFFLGAAEEIDGAPFLAAPAGTPPGPLAEPAAGRRRVGLSWGSVRQGMDGHKVVPPELFAALPAGRDAEFFAFATGLDPADAAPVLALAHDLTPYIRDFADTARALAALDLVVTIDTAVAHLAGALGRPVWLLLNYGADWRWFDGSASPWYGNARLFRQPAPGDWPAVLAEAAAALDAWLAGS